MNKSLPSLLFLHATVLLNAERLRGSLSDQHTDPFSSTGGDRRKKMMVKPNFAKDLLPSIPEYEERGIGKMERVIGGSDAMPGQFP